MKGSQPKILVMENVPNNTLYGYSGAKNQTVRIRPSAIS